MGVPAFLLRKLYKRGSLHETADGGFAFTLTNPLGSATIDGPPKFVVNGVSYAAQDLEAESVELETISPETPFAFDKGTQVEIRFPGHLLRGGNRIHISVPTKEFGKLDFLVEDKCRPDDAEE